MDTLPLPVTGCYPGSPRPSRWPRRYPLSKYGLDGPRRQDYEYRREGVRNLFLACEPRRIWRHVAVTQRRTRQEFSHHMRWLANEAYPEAQVVRKIR